MLPAPLACVVVVICMSPLMAIIAPASAVRCSLASSLIRAALLPGRCISSIFMTSPELRVEPAGQAGQRAGLDRDAALALHARDQPFAAEQARHQAARELQFQRDARVVGDEVAGVDD